jgi:AcrR family transcriptional regulator
MAHRKVIQIFAFVPQMGAVWMEILEENKTKKWIIEALFELLKYKEYQDITISQIVNKAGLGRRTFYRYFKTKDEVMEYTTNFLMNQFANTVMINHADTLATITKSYFEFWENYIDLLLLLNKAHLLYYIEDNLLELIYEVALKVGHIPLDMNYEDVMGKYNQYKYEFAFKLAGFWKVTLVWCSENPRKTPEEMSELIVSMVK